MKDHGTWPSGSIEKVFIEGVGWKHIVIDDDCDDEKMEKIKRPLHKVSKRFDYE